MSTDTLPVRSTDPDTSYAAAAKAAMGASKIRPIVYEILCEKGPLTHDELIGEYHSLVVREPDTPRASDSGIRTRLTELRKARLVVEHEEKGHSNFGNAAKKWLAVRLVTDLDPAELPYLEDIE